jgi:peptide/nickel transport system permease protein
MLAVAARRLLASIPVLLVATFATFAIVSATFDPTARLARVGDGAQARAEVRERLGLDDPLVLQYGRWLGNAVRGDFGESYRSREPVADMVRPALGNTLQLVGWGILFATVLAVAIGVVGALRQRTALDHGLTALMLVAVAMPPFWFGLLSQQFAVNLREWTGSDEPILYVVGLHSSGHSGFDLDYLRHLALPVLVLTVQLVASWSRFQRSEMLDVLGSDYVRTARAKGVPRREIVYRHALRNALAPLVTVMALDVGALFGGLVITEQLFAIPGMGRLFLSGLLNGDAPVVLAWLLVSGVFVILFNLVADLLYRILDPRVQIR